MLAPAQRQKEKSRKAWATRHMLKKIVCALLIYFALCACPGLSQVKARVISGQRTDGFGSYLLVIPSNEFRKDELLQLAKRYLRRYSNINLLQVGIYVDRETAADSRGKHIDHYSFDMWKREFASGKQKKSLCAAELLKYGTAATLRIRYPDAKIEEIVITGENVFHPIVSGVAFNLLHMTVVFQGFSTARELMPMLYFSTSKGLTAEDAEAFAKTFLRMSGASRLKIYMRQDEWFISDSFYPWNNPFSAAEAPPSEAEAARSDEFLCAPAEKQACYQSHVGVR